MDELERLNDLISGHLESAVNLAYKEWMNSDIRLPPGTVMEVICTYGDAIDEVRASIEKDIAHTRALTETLTN